MKDHFSPPHNFLKILRSFTFYCYYLLEETLVKKSLLASKRLNEKIKKIF